jgi:uncharacterized protein YrzB (UPF0473 family)
MKDLSIVVNGQRLNVLFSFKYQDKDYLVYSTPEEEISASIYKMNGNKLTLLPIETEEEWDYVDKMIEKRNDL